MKKIIIFLVAVVAFAAMAITTKAVSDNSNGNGSDNAASKKEEKIQTLNEKRKDRMEERCNRFRERIGEKITNIGEKKEKHNNVYSGIISRVEALISKLKEKDYDTTELEKDLATFKEKISKFNEDFETLSNKISGAKEADCSSEESKIKLNLGETRTLIQTVQKDAKDIRTFYQDEIRPDLQALKVQKEEVKNGAETE